MDLSLHENREDISKTIFEDADYFSRNYLYKLMPITSEAVNETIIHMEHNYCNLGSSDGENVIKSCIHTEAEERNYKRRRSKSSCGTFSPSAVSDYERDDETEKIAVISREGITVSNSKPDEDYLSGMQPLDLSVPIFHEQKTDKTAKENIRKGKSESRAINNDVNQFNMSESNKENVTSCGRKIQVTVSRPGSKGCYKPCEVFLNDLVRISPDLIKNDCYEIEIIDRTGQDLEREKYRTYYIVSASTWHTFENSTERILLTNDVNVGEPIRNIENFEKPTYLIFDRYSLTESLANMCEQKGGSFEYTCLEETSPHNLDNRRQVQECLNDLPLGRIISEEQRWKSGGQIEAETNRSNNLTETNILKRLLLCDKENTDSPTIRDVADNAKLETEENVSYNCGSVSGKADGKQGETVHSHTESQVPIPLIMDQGVQEGTHRKEDTAKSEKKLELMSEIKCTAICKEETNDMECGKEKFSKDLTGESRPPSARSNGNKSDNVENVLSRDTAINIKNKRKSKKTSDEETKSVDANSLSKRVTRSGASLTKGKLRGNNEQWKKKSEVNDVGRKKVKPSGKGEKIMGKKMESRKKVERETRHSRKSKEIPPKSVARREKNEKLTEKIVPFDGNLNIEKRETRSRAKIRAMENFRKTRLSTGCKLKKP